VRLTDRDRAMLSGDCGAAARMAMSILVKMAEICGADELLDISAAHIDSTIYIGEANLEFAERLASQGARVFVPTTLNVSGLDEHHWKDWPVPKGWAEKALRHMKAYESMGCIPTWTCAPYQTEMKPLFGQQIAWGESNAVVYANSVIGARTERYPDLLDICCAITGRVPAIGLHLTENRAGNVLIRLGNVPPALQKEDSFYPVLGHLIGKIAQNQIPVLEGISVQPSEDQLKALGAAAASSGSTALFHLVGITPEAPNLEAAFQGRKPYRVIAITMDALCAARSELTTAKGDELDMVVIGCPHLSLSEFKELATMVDGEHLNPKVRFLVTTNRGAQREAEKAGYLNAIAAFGGKVTVDTCILATPMLPLTIETIMTNSAKFAYYSPGILDRRVIYGGLRDCVNSAIHGHVVVDDALWEM
jgi:predicted aconitase